MREVWQVLVQDAEGMFDDFVRARSTHLFRLAVLLTGHDRAAAEDLLQVALERAYRHRHKVFGSDAPEPYVRRILVNAALDWRRVLRRRQEQPWSPTDVGPATGDSAELVADRDLLVRALAVLPPRQRAVLVLRYWEDLSEVDTAAVLGCSVGTVKSHASRGLARLREQAGTYPARETGLGDTGGRDA